MPDSAEWVWAESHVRRSAALLRSAFLVAWLSRRLRCTPLTLRRLPQTSPPKPRLASWSAALCAACLRLHGQLRGVAVLCPPLGPALVRLGRRPVLCLPKPLCQRCPGAPPGILVDPRLWLNVTSERDGVSEPLPEPGTSLDWCLEAGGERPRKASELKLALVKSPAYQSDSDVAGALQAHFRSAQILALGDVFPVGEFCFRVSAVSRSEGGNWDQTLDSAWEEAAGAKCLYSAQRISTHLYQVTEVNARRISEPEWAQVRSPPPPFDGLCRRLVQLASSAFVSGESLSVLLCGPSGSGKAFLASCLAFRLGCPLVRLSALAFPADAPAASEARLRLQAQRLASACPALLLLDQTELFGLDPHSGETEPRLVAALEELQRTLAKAPLPVHLVASAESLKAVPLCLLRLFDEHVQLPRLRRDDRTALLQRLLGDQPRVTPEAVAEAGSRAQGLVLADLVALAEESRESGDLVAALEAFQAASADSARIPKVSWSDVGGLDAAKAALAEAVALAKAGGGGADGELRRSGLLLHGPPGCGKTLLAKAVATESRLAFLSVKGPELLNMYVGESEAGVRRTFAEARAAAPCVVFLDELDALAPNRGLAGDSGGVMDRVVASLLSEMEASAAAVEEDGAVLVIAATNRPDLIDPSLLRPARFDRLIYVGLSGDRESQAEVLRAQLRRLPVSWDGGSEAQLLDLLPHDVSGADIYGVVSEAGLGAFSRGVVELEAGGLADQRLPLTVTFDDLRDAAQRITTAPA